MSFKSNAIGTFQCGWIHATTMWLEKRLYIWFGMVFLHLKLES
jgi:hypothetical protein